MADRTTPYLAFNFQVALTQGSGSQPSGGFSDVSGLSTEITEAERSALGAWIVSGSKLN